MTLPAPGEIVPMACARAPAPFDDPAYRFEPKLDGIRLLAYADARGDVRLFGRRGREATARYPEVARAVAAALDGTPAVLDGEAVVLDEEGRCDFAAVLRRENVDVANAERLAAECPVTYHAFDLIAVEDRSLLDAPLEARRAALLEHVVPPDAGLRVVDFLPAGGVRAFRAAVEAGFEGVVGKRLGSPYRPGSRGGDWVKVKRADAADLVVGAWAPGRGSLAGTVGALLVGAYDDAGNLRLLGSVGSGLAHAERDALREALDVLAAEASPFLDPLPRGARPVRPAIVAEVSFLAVTRDGRLRAPIFRGVRPDKAPAECRLATELAAAARAGLVR